jgi:hypothetical protein
MNPNNPDAILDAIESAAMTVRNIELLSVTDVTFNRPRNMSKIEFSALLFIVKREITGSTPPEALGRVQEFIASVQAANPTWSA